jgi:mono/diheme cytochrome c family protein
MPRYALPAVAALAAGALVACAPPPEKEGARLYDTYCTACHGATARGDGPVAGDLDRPVPDLTRIAARNGGAFPTGDVVATIDGYTRVREGNATMPEFGAELEAGRLVFYDLGDGRPVPTPSKLVALAEYLRTIQR